MLDDLGAQVRRGGPTGLGGERHATGLPELDRLLGGGLPLGGLSELVGPASSGRTSLALALLAHTTAHGHFAAWVDPVDAFDPVSAEAAGVDLARVLWARPSGTAGSLRSLEQILTAQGFALVVWDRAALSATAPAAPATRASAAGAAHETVPAAAWPRLRKAAASARAALVLVGASRVAGPFADVALELAPRRARFASGPDWLVGLDTELTLARSRLGPSQDALTLSFRLEPELPEREAAPAATGPAERAAPAATGPARALRARAG